MEEVQQPWQAVAQQALQRLQQQGLMPVQPPGAGGGEAGAGSELQAQEDMEMMQETLHHHPEQLGQMVDEAIHQAQQNLQQAQEAVEVEEEDQQTSNSSDEGVSLLETTPTL